MTQSEKRKQHTVDIRPATPADAREIRLTAAGVKLTPGAQAESGKEGFLIFVPSEAEYARRLSGTHTALVAAIADGIAGYLLAYRSSEFAASGKADDPVIRRIESRESGPFVYIDQIVVKPLYRRQGIAQALIGQLYQLTPGHPHYAAIAVKPLVNTASLKLFRDILGWTRRDSIKIGNVAGDIFTDKQS